MTLATPTKRDRVFVDAGRRGAQKRWAQVRTKTISIADLNADQAELVRALVAAARAQASRELGSS